MNRFAALLASLVVVIGTANSRADEPCQQWLKLFVGEWQESLMGRTTVWHSTPVAGGHAVVLRSAGDEAVALVGWQADRKTLVQNLYSANGGFVQSEATEVGDRRLRGTRVGRPAGTGPLFKGTDEWRRIDDDRFEIGFDGHMGQAKVTGKIEFARLKQAAPQTAERKPAPIAAPETDHPYREWLKYLEGDWDAQFGDGNAVVFREKLVAGGRALLNLPDGGGVVLTGWRSDLNALVQSTFIPEGTYQRNEMTEIREATMSGTCRGWVAPLGVAYTGKEVWHKIDENRYTVDVDLDLAGVRYQTTHKFTRKASGN